MSTSHNSPSRPVSGSASAPSVVGASNPYYQPRSGLADGMGVMAPTPVGGLAASPTPSRSVDNASRDLHSLSLNSSPAHGISTPTRAQTAGGAVGGPGARGGGSLSMRKGPGKLSFGSQPTPQQAQPNIFNSERNALTLRAEDEQVTIPTQTVHLPNGTEISPESLKQLEEIGRGAYGAVHRSIYEPTKTIIAVKYIPMDITEESKKLQLIRELNVLRTATDDTEPCPYIVKYYGAYFREGDICICMEFMDGGCFDVIYKKTGPIPEKILGKISVAVVHGLHYLKSRLQIIHRDVKPSNILVDSSGKIKLCDFGISGRLENSVAKTYVGTNHYMSPERIALAGQYDIRSDVWSLGIALVELATAKYPYPPDASIFGILRHIVDGPAPSVPEGQFSPEFVAFLSKCLQKDHEKRANYVELLQTDFIKKYEQEEVDVAGWVQDVQSKIAVIRAAERVEHSHFPSRR
ncbi:mitogen-activated protein kinase kinase 4 [Capsaspora owczarzaki ATCC 30864]|uniref:mitogen-activated protein kinase kinase n=1 Tax=Capsaspora owczarzaki (strain ATCC 30864) TaxID=595528 RepID=A0A0D2UII8_CAPO3|nr:mitogen-activated protein kinase kinase 4 [Capsaspora owczarzaki ATCC 30864]KJE94951.1 STE/STE7 protein kinase [Capsaspora owczarzaki ATCC 30864]|eukprot:XP_004346163.1 mitogen-activated protein kinase kinase 4 [Capsaspora owczarzaki ATCC 30864]